MVVDLRGDWTFANASAIERTLAELARLEGQAVEFRCADLGAIDLTGWRRSSPGSRTCT
jgi:hypothetical protein